MPKIVKIKGDTPFSAMKTSTLLTAAKRAEINIVTYQASYPKLFKNQEIVDRYRELLIREYEKIDTNHYNSSEVINNNNMAITFKFYYALAFKHTVTRSQAKSPEFLKTIEDLRSFNKIFLQQWYDKSFAFSSNPIAAQIAKMDIIKSINTKFTLPIIDEPLPSLLIRCV